MIYLKLIAYSRFHADWLGGFAIVPAVFTKSLGRSERNVSIGVGAIGHLFNL